MLVGMGQGDRKIASLGTMCRMAGGGKRYQEYREKRERALGAERGWGPGTTGLNRVAWEGWPASEIRAKLVECVAGRGPQGQRPHEGRGVAGPDGMGPHGSRSRLWLFLEGYGSHGRVLSRGIPHS